MSGNTVRTPVIDKNGRLTHVHKSTDDGSGASSRISSVGKPPTAKSQSSLSDQQMKVLTDAYNLKPVTMSDGSIHDGGHLVSGHKYRTALALESKGLASVRYQGPSMGWVKPTAKGSALVNFERITAEANITDKEDPNYNTDMDVIFPGTQSTYRDMILAGFNPNDAEDQDAFVEAMNDY